MNKRTKKLEKGVTLIALVITIIVLLILAGVSIAMLTGDNGILTKATEAKEKTQKAEVIERVQTDIIGVKGENKSGDITKAQLKTILAKYFKDVPETIPEDLSNLTLTTQDKYGNYLIKVSDIYDGTISSDETPAEKTVMEYAKQAMPSGARIDTSTNEETGIVMIDSKGNEWVWVEVPSTVFSADTTATNYDAIKADLIAYATDYRGSYTDEWYAIDGSTLVTASTEGLTDAQKLLNNGCGLAYAEYNTAYQTMLSSVYNNKGFYIARYEAGIEGSDTDTSLARTEDSSSRITDTTISTLPKAVSKQDMIPYNFVYCSEAQKLASGMATGSKKSSLLFGIQWDLTCKFLEEKTDLRLEDIKTDSTSWGNYNNAKITNLNGKYAICNQSSYLLGDWNTIPNSYEKPSSGTENWVSLTTGATEYTNKKNIYDFAGNEWEVTLEHATTDTGLPCTYRGGSCIFTGSSFPASTRNNGTTTSSNSDRVFRSSLY